MYFLAAILCLFFGTVPGFIYSDHSIFDNRFNHSSGDKIDEIAIMGPQYSGTAYTYLLIKKNFPNYKIADTFTSFENKQNKYSYKHCFPWFDLTEFQIPKKEESQINRKALNKDPLKGSENCLFICTARNPYDWICKFGFEQKAKGENLHDWIFKPWTPTFPKDMYSVENWNPYEGRPFANLLELRKYKILNSLQISSLVNHFMLIRYEDLIRFSEEFINYLAETFRLEKAVPFQSVDLDTILGLRTFLTPQDEPLAEEDRIDIERHLDWDVESFLGYAPSYRRIDRSPKPLNVDPQFAPRLTDDDFIELQNLFDLMVKGEFEMLIHLEKNLDLVQKFILANKQDRTRCLFYFLTNPKNLKPLSEQSKNLLVQKSGRGNSLGQDPILQFMDMELFYQYCVESADLLGLDVKVMESFMQKKKYKEFFIYFFLSQSAKKREVTRI